MVKGLLEQKLIACATMIPHVESMYHWEGKIEHGNEVKVILKTRESLFEKTRDYIEKNCSYDVPEIMEVKVERGNPRYQKWILDETQQ